MLCDDGDDAVVAATVLYAVFRTVHKSQGQTLDAVGIYFSRPSWAHGLLYVAASRVRSVQTCFIVCTSDVVNVTDTHVLC